METEKVIHTKRKLMQRHNFMISATQVEMLKTISAFNHVSTSELVRQGIQLVIDEYNNAIRTKSES